MGCTSAPHRMGLRTALRESSPTRARDAFRCRPAQRWCDAALCACQKRARDWCRTVSHEERRDGVALLSSAAGRAYRTCLNAHRRSFDSTGCLPPASRLRMLACSLHRHWAYECRSGDAAGAHRRHTWLRHNAVPRQIAKLRAANQQHRTTASPRDHHGRTPFLFGAGGTLPAGHREKLRTSR